jgi:outer membrane biosynthesis protein TonB
MPNDDDTGLGPGLEKRLRDELDGVQPRFSSPRYLATKPRPAIWRLAPAALAASIVAILGLSFYAETGSANPVVWTRRVVTVLQPPASSPAPSERRESPAPAQTPERHESPEPSEKPEPGESPEPAQSPEANESPEPQSSPEPSDGHSGSDSGSGSGSGSGSDSGDSSHASPSPSGDH